MKRNLLASLTALAAVCACSSSSSGGTTTGGGGGGDAGFTNVTFATVDIHPAAKAALMAAGAPVPSILGTSPGGGPYKLVVQGVSIAAGPKIVLTTIYSVPITTNGPYVVPIYNGDLVAEAPLGVLGGIAPSTPDGGDVATSTSGLAQLPCSAVEAAGVADALADGGIPDYFFPTGSQVGGAAQPPSADVTNAVAYAIPMSYASMLNCAGNATKTTQDSSQGVAIVYATNGNGPAVGSPVSGLTFSVQKGPSAEPTPTYYTDNFTGVSTAGTDSTGVATIVDIVTGNTPPTLATNGGSVSYFVPGIATSSNSFFNTFVYVP